MQGPKRHQKSAAAKPLFSYLDHGKKCGFRRRVVTHTYTRPRIPLSLSLSRRVGAYGQSPPPVSARGPVDPSRPPPARRNACQRSMPLTPPRRLCATVLAPLKAFPPSSMARSLLPVAPHSPTHSPAATLPHHHHRPVAPPVPPTSPRPRMARCWPVDSVVSS